MAFQCIQEPVGRRCPAQRGITFEPRGGEQIRQRPRDLGQLAGLGEPRQRQLAPKELMQLNLPRWVRAEFGQCPAKNFPSQLRRRRIKFLQEGPERLPARAGAIAHARD
jgi:hypothetical protein